MDYEKETRQRFRFLTDDERRRSYRVFNISIVLLWIGAILWALLELPGIPFGQYDEKHYQVGRFLSDLTSYIFIASAIVALGTGLLMCLVNFGRWRPGR